MKESDIRPSDLFDEYLRLSALDAEVFFSNTARSSIPCIGCGGGNVDNCFIKHGFQYVQCKECETLYLSPRPPAEVFEQFYENSVSSNYWAETFFPAVAESRRERIFKTRAVALADMCAKKSIATDTIIDVGAGYGIFLEEWAKINSSSRLIAIEPSASLSQVCREKGFDVIEAVAEKAAGAENTADLLVCFEVLEHVTDPLVFVEVLKNLVKPGGYLMISTLGIEGFDIQVLWERSNSISPPHHLNFFSIKGFEALFSRAGMTSIEITTPGVLDTDIVKNSLKATNTDLNMNRFIKKLVSNPDLAQKFQTFLIENKCSSHTWIFAQRPNE